MTASKPLKKTKLVSGFSSRKSLRERSATLKLPVLVTISAQAASCNSVGV
jgi:hypothetical protein